MPVPFFYNSEFLVKLGYIMKKALSIVLLICIATPLSATVYNFYSTERLIELAQEWEQSQSTIEAAQYVGYVGAIFDYLSVKQRICTPEEVSKNEVINIVTDYLTALENDIELSGAINVSKVLIRQYPC